MSLEYWTDKRGYERSKGNAKIDGEWMGTPKLRLHRLCAVAWFGWDSVVERDVHHRVPIPWLNVESNLLTLPKPEHSHLTAKFQNGETPQSVVDDVTDSFGGGVDG